MERGYKVPIFLILPEVHEGTVVPSLSLPLKQGIFIARGGPKKFLYHAFQTLVMLVQLVI